MTVDLAHQHDIDWPDDVFTLPRDCFDVDEKPCIIVEHHIPPFRESGFYAVYNQEEKVVDGVSLERARRRAIELADETGAPILTPVERT